MITECSLTPENEVGCVFGLIEFIGNRAVIHRIDIEEYVDKSIAIDYCEKKISSGQHDSYVIPDMFYVGRSRGVLDFSFCRNSF